MKFTSVIVAALVLLPVLASAQERTLNLFQNPIQLPKSAKDIILSDVSIANLPSVVRDVEGSCSSDWSIPCTRRIVLAKTKVLQVTISYFDRNAGYEAGDFQTAKINLPVESLTAEQIAIISKNGRSRREVMKEALGLTVAKKTTVVMVQDLENSDMCPHDNCNSYQERMVYKPYNQVTQEVTVTLKK